MTQLQKERVRLFKLSLKPNSKWYAQDVKEFSANILNEKPEASKKQISNINYMNSESFEKEVERLEKQLQKAGMYNIGNMTALNCLD